MKRLGKGTVVLLFSALMVFTANAATEFDSEYYAAAYPDVAATLGTDYQTLLNHYLT